MQIAETKIEKMKAEEGYFTIEAIFLVTMLFSIMFVVIMSGLYGCDLNHAESFLGRRVTELSRDEKAYEDSERMEDRKQIKTLLFVTELKNYSIVKSGGKVKGTVELSLRLNVPLIGDWFGSLWKDSFSLCVDVGNNVEQLRRWNQIE